MNATVSPLMNLGSRTTFEVKRLSCWSFDERERYLDDGMPLIFSGGAAHWRALASWGPDYLRATLGHRRIFVKIYDAVARHRIPRTVGMTVAEFLATQSGPDAHLYKIGDVPIEDFLPELQQDVEPPGLLTSKRFRTGIFIGQDSFCPMHYHTHDEAVLTQVTGTKTVLLYPPGDTACVYPVPWYVPFHNWSQVNVESPDHERFPLFRDARVHVATLHPGDMLFIPVHWWHATFGSGFSTSLTYFWSANPKRWAFPSPGLRVLFSPYALLVPVFFLGRKLVGRRLRKTDGLAATSAIKREAPPLHSADGAQR